MSLIEAIAVIRDVVIILAAIIITATVVMVGRVILDVTRKTAELRAFAVDAVTGMLNPVKGVLLAIGRRPWR